MDNQNTTEEFARILINAKNKIKTIVPGAPLLNPYAQDEFVDLASCWYQESAGHAVWLRPIFSQVPLKGVFQWEDKFRIRPLNNTDKIGKGLNFEDLAQTPGREKGHLGPPYPLVLEVAVPKAVPPLLFDPRGIRRIDQLEALISVLLTQRITSARTLRKQWTSIWDGQKILNHLLNGGFDIGEDSQLEGFSADNHQKVPVFAGHSYYDHLWVRDEEISLPPNLDDLLRKYYAMNKSVRSAFNRACYWFLLGIGQEPAISIVAFSNAIECLLPRPSKNQCEHCKKPNGKGPTKLFKKHLQKYAPILESLEPMRDEIYNVRSALVHGARLDAIDLDWTSPLRTDRDTSFLLEVVARRSLVNWLADPERCNPTKAVDDQ